jgi:uncharacterized membrane protein
MVLTPHGWVFLAASFVMMVILGVIIGIIILAASNGSSGGY